MFLNKPKFKDREIDWCEMCQTHIISCKKCQGTTCNCMGCEECKEDIKAFDLLKPWPHVYLSKEENKVVAKYLRIKTLLLECLSEGKSLDYQWLYDEGKFCENDWELLDLKFPKYNMSELLKKYQPESQ